MRKNSLFALKRCFHLIVGNLPLLWCLASTFLLFAIDCHQQQQPNDSLHQSANNASMSGSSTTLSAANVTTTESNHDNRPSSSAPNDATVPYSQRHPPPPFNGAHPNQGFHSRPLHSHYSHSRHAHSQHPHPHDWHQHEYHAHDGHYHHRHHHHDPHHSPSSIYYQPQIHLIDADRLALASRTLISDLAVGVGRAFHNIIKSQPNSRSGIVPGSLLNNERVRSTASKLLPAASKLVERHVDPATGQNQTVTDGNATSPINYEVEGKKLREDIVSKLGNLQTILATTLEVTKERRDMFTRTLLDQTNHRLELAKERAQKVLSEPSNSERAVRTLYVLNQGINSISSFMQTLIGTGERTKAIQNTDSELDKATPGQEEQTKTVPPSTKVTKA